jgi:hypothetical protein
MSPVLVNPYLSFGGGIPPIDLTEPWGEVARQETITAGKLTLSGLGLSGLSCVRLLINGLKVTTDDSQVLLRYQINGSDVTTGYEWLTYIIGSGVNTFATATGAGEISLTHSTATNLLGNDATESLNAVVDVHAPTGSQQKLCYYSGEYLLPSNNFRVIPQGAARLNNAGAIDGFVVYATSNLTAGTVIVLGLE